MYSLAFKMFPQLIPHAEQGGFDFRDRHSEICGYILDARRPPVSPDENAYLLCALAVKKFINRGSNFFGIG